MLISMLVGVAALGLQDIEAPVIRDDQPIDVSAGRCETFEKEDTLECSGRVRVTQAGTILSADHMTIIGVNDEGGPRRMVAKGNVRYSNDVNAMSGEKAVYVSATTTLTVTGDVVVVQKDQVMTGGKLIYNTTTGEIEFLPGPTGRVRGVFYTAPEEGAPDS